MSNNKKDTITQYWACEEVTQGILNPKEKDGFWGLLALNKLPEVS